MRVVASGDGGSGVGEAGVGWTAVSTSRSASDARSFRGASAHRGGGCLSLTAGRSWGGGRARRRVRRGCPHEGGLHRRHVHRAGRRGRLRRPFIGRAELDDRRLRRRRRRERRGLVVGGEHRVEGPVDRVERRGPLAAPREADELGVDGAGAARGTRPPGKVGRRLRSSPRTRVGSRVSASTDVGPSGVPARQASRKSSSSWESPRRRDEGVGGLLPASAADTSEGCDAPRGAARSALRTRGRRAGRRRRGRRGGPPGRSGARSRWTRRRGSGAAR